MSQVFFFYPHILDNLVPPESGFDVYQDMGDKRLRLYITARGIKTFFVRKRVNGKDVRIILGKYPEISIDKARAKLDEKLEQIEHPVKLKPKKMLFSKAVQNFILERVHRETKSKQKLTRQIKSFWEKLFDRYINEIKSDELIEISKNIAENHGVATANRMREIAKSLFNFAMEKNWTDKNPALSIAQIPEHRRKNTLTIPGIKKIIAKIKQEKDPVLRSAFLMIIYGFMRKSEVFSMTWNDLDLRHDFYKTLPLTDQASLLLREMPQNGKWIFPSEISRGHIKDPRTSWTKIVNSAGLPDTQINDCSKLLRLKLKWSNNPETLRINMNKVLELLK